MQTSRWPCGAYPIFDNEEEKERIWDEATGNASATRDI